MKKFIAVLATIGLLLLGGSPAMADDRPNYTVTEQGVQLPEGYKFEANGHVNIKWKDADGEHSGGMHLDPNNNQPGGYYIGKSFFDFTSIIKSWDKCPQVTWVQVHGWNYHYTAEYDPNKCPTPPGDEDDDSDNSSDDTSDSGADLEGDKSDDGSKDGDSSDHDSDSLDDDKVDTSANSDDNGTEDPTASDDGTGSDPDGQEDPDAGKDSTKDPDAGDDGNPNGDPDGGEIPPTGLSGGIMIGALGLGLIIVGGLVVANSRGRKN